MNIIDNLFYPVRNCEEIALLLCKELHVPFTKKALTQAILFHPDYPSLLTVSDVMKDYGVENVSLRITEISKLAKLPQPFVAQVLGKEKREKLFALVYSITETKVTWYNPDRHRKEEIACTDFNKKFTGYIQAYQKNTCCGEKGYEAHRRKEKAERLKELFYMFSLPLLVLFISIIFLIQEGWATSLFPLFYILFTLIGALAGLVLLLYEVDEYNPMLRKVCTHGQKTNCGAILHSKGAKIYGIPWSVLGFSYFMGVLSALLSGSIVHPPLLCVAAWINVLALPYIIYSIYYQARIARQWCTMCLTVQAVLLLLFITSLLGGFLSDYCELSWKDVLPFIINFLIIFLATSLLLPALEKAKGERHSQNELQRLKHNSQIFEALLVKQKKIIEYPEGLGITLGNPSGRVHIIKVCNPYCNPCAKAHPFVDTLLDNNPEIRLQIIFSTGALTDTDERLLPVKHLLGIAATQDVNTVRQALDDWYLAKEKNYANFSIKYPISDSLLQQQWTFIKEMESWVDGLGVGFTPAFFVDGYLLSDIYSIQDLQYFYSQ